MLVVKYYTLAVKYSRQVLCYSRDSYNRQAVVKYYQVLCYSRQVLWERVFFYSRQVFLCYSRQVMYAVVESGIML